MKLINIIILLIFISFVHKGFSQHGGGIYAEDGAKVIGCVIAENSAAGSGFGICGGDTELLNCTVGNNVPAGKLTKTIDIGYIFCKDDSIVSKEVYEAEGRTDAAGVVFWVNSDRYTKVTRAYVTALKQAQKPRGDFWMGEIFRFAVFDTACYAETMALANAGSEAAVYCREYMKGTVLEGRWLMPASYQLSCLFTAHYQVDKTLEFLKNKGVDADIFEEDMYWATSNPNLKIFFVVDFSSKITSSTSAGTCSATQEFDEWHWVRPILIY